MSGAIGIEQCTLQSKRDRGFSLVEVLVALVVVSVGLLGLAKMESLALSSTTVAGVRSVVAGQAANLAAMMHADQDYWQNSIVPTSTTFTSATIPAAAKVCTTPGANACSPQDMASYDLNVWATALKGVLPFYSTAISCSTPTATAPASCAIQITWFDNAVAMTAQQTNGTITALAAQPTTYTLYVQP
jgi:type IV pilus assembly protein PilV